MVYLNIYICVELFFFSPRENSKSLTSKVNMSKSILFTVSLLHKSVISHQTKDETSGFISCFNTFSLRSEKMFLHIGTVSTLFHTLILLPVCCICLYLFYKPGQSYSVLQIILKTEIGYVSCPVLLRALLVEFMESLVIDVKETGTRVCGKMFKVHIGKELTVTQTTLL